MTCPTTNDRAARYKSIGAGTEDRLVISARIYVDYTGSHSASVNNGVFVQLVGTDDNTDNWLFKFKISSDGIFVQTGVSSYNEIGDETPATDEWVNWTFDLRNLSDRSTATVDIYKEGAYLGSSAIYQYDFGTPGRFEIGAYCGNQIAQCYYDFVEVGESCEDSWSLPSDSSESESSSSSSSLDKT
jgi:hypothetical protein